MGEDVIFHRAAQALRLPEGELPNVLPALGTTGDSISNKTLLELTIEMYETHKESADPTEVYRANQHSRAAEGTESEEEDDGPEWEMADTPGQVFTTKPKKKTKSRNAPGAAESAQRGTHGLFQTDS